MIETHRSFVNRWECDENSHMNVQFYLKRFDEASRIYRALVPATGAAGDLAMRHVRYHKELDEGDGAIIRTGLVSEGPFKGRMVHVMTHAITGEICTTALDTITTADIPGDNPAAVFLDTVPDAVLPRGLDAGLIEPAQVDELLASGRAITTHYSIVEADELAGNGTLITNRIVSRFTDGAPHVWDHGGVTTSWLQENNFGRVAVEMKIMSAAACEPGTALRLISWVAEVSGRTMRIQHQLQEINGGAVVALGAVRCLVMDLEKRKAVALPEGLAAS